MEEEEPKEAVRWRTQVGGDGDEVTWGSNTVTDDSGQTSNGRQDMDVRRQIKYRV